MTLADTNPNNGHTTRSNRTAMDDDTTLELSSGDLMIEIKVMIMTVLVVVPVVAIGNCIRYCYT